MYKQKVASLISRIAKKEVLIGFVSQQLQELIEANNVVNSDFSGLTDTIDNILSAASTINDSMVNKTYKSIENFIKAKDKKIIQPLEKLTDSLVKISIELQSKVTSDLTTLEDKIEDKKGLWQRLAKLQQNAQDCINKAKQIITIARDERLGMQNKQASLNKVLLPLKIKAIEDSVNKLTLQIHNLQQHEHAGEYESDNNTAQTSLVFSRLTQAIDEFKANRSLAKFLRP